MSVRSTTQQIAIRRVLESAGRPLCPSEILEGARHEVPNLGQATVYRGIQRLLAREDIRRVKLPGLIDRYEWGAGHHHHHFLCRSCEKLFELNACPGGLEKLAPKGFLAEDHDLLIKGLCPQCREPGS